MVGKTPLVRRKATRRAARRSVQIRPAIAVTFTVEIAGLARDVPTQFNLDSLEPEAFLALRSQIMAARAALADPEQSDLQLG